jgi:hypothetical protein
MRGLCGECNGLSDQGQILNHEPAIMAAQNLGFMQAFACLRPINSFEGSRFRSLRAALWISANPLAEWTFRVRQRTSSSAFGGH